MSSRSPKRLKTAASPPSSSSKQQASLTSFFGKAPSKAASSSSTSSGGEGKRATGTPASATGSTTTPAAASSDSQPKTKATSFPVPTTTDPIIPQPRVWNESPWKVYENAVIYRKNKASTTPPRAKVAAFDMDGTLLTWRTSGWPSKLTDYELWNAAVLTKLRKLYDEDNYQLIIVSNQGAIRGAFTGKKATFVKGLIEWLIATIDRPVSVVLSTDKKKGFHKPSVRLWQAAQTLLGDDSCKWNIAESFYVGDSVGGEDDPQGGVDITLARNVSELTGETLRFYTPEDFFGPSHAVQRQTTVVVKPLPAGVPTTRAALCSGNLEGPLLLMLCGAQGSGKSTVAQRIVEGNEDTWATFSQDSIRNGKPGKREQVEEAVKEALQEQKKCVIVDRMHLDASQREPFVQMAQNLGIAVHALVLSPPSSVLAQRVKNRVDHPGKVEGEKGALLAVGSAGKLVAPTYDEGFALVSATSSTNGLDKFVRLYRQVTLASSASSEEEHAPNSLPTEFPLLVSKQEIPRALPSVVLGTMGLGRRMAEQVVKQAIEIGLTGVDTAPTYKNEDKMGPVLVQNTFVIVKVPKRCTTAAEVADELQTSLKSLQRDQADLLLLHWPSLPSDTLKDVWQAMEEAVLQGKANALGVCNANMSALASLLPQCRIRPSVLQIERHPLLPQFDLVDFCAQQDIQIQAHTPLGQGKADLLDHAVVKDVASRHPKASAAQVVLSWNVQQGVAVAPKASSKEHMEEFQSLPQLSAKDLDALNRITDRKRFVAPPFMYGSDPYCWGKHAPK